MKRLLLIVLVLVGCTQEPPELVSTTTELRCDWFSITPRVDMCYMGPVTCFKVEKRGALRECEIVAVWCQVSDTERGLSDITQGLSDTSHGG